MEIMEEMAAHQDIGYDRLYKWVQEEITKLDIDAPDISKLLRQSFVLLRQREAYFRYQ